MQVEATRQATPLVRKPPTSTMFSMARRDRRAYLLITDLDDGRVLVLRNRRGSWTLPGGRARRGEKLRQAAVREAFEETGLVVSPTVRVARQRSRRRLWKVFLADAPPPLDPKPRREIRQVRWVCPEQAVKLLRKKVCRQAVQALSSHLSFR